MRNEFQNTLLLTFMTLILFSCISDKKLSDIELEENIFLECKNLNWWEREVFIASDNYYKMQIPFGWETVENAMEELNGFVAADTSNGFINSNWLSLIYIDNNENLSKYFTSELEKAKKDPNYNVLSFGKYDSEEKKGYWMLYEDKNEDIKDIIEFSRSIVYYPITKSKRQFIITVATFGEKDYLERQCNLFESIKSLEIE